MEGGDLGGCRGIFWVFRWVLRGGGYLGIGMGGEGDDEEEEEEVDCGSFGGGEEGREEKRLSPGNEATMAMEITAL